MSTLPKNHLEVLEFADKSKIKNGVLCPPTLWSRDARGKFRFWNVYIGIINPDNDQLLEVTQEYIDRQELPTGHVGAYWTESGVEGTVKPILSEYKYIMSGKNVNRANYTTAFTQAIIDAKSDYNKRIKDGNQADRTILNQNATVTLDELISQTQRSDKPWRVFAMALHDVAKDNWKRVKFPCYAQVKLDGTLFITVFHEKLPKLELTTDNGGEIITHIDGYSRGRLTYEGQEHILMELAGVLPGYPGLHLVGDSGKRDMVCKTFPV